MKKNSPVKIVFDSNIYISAIFGGLVKKQFSQILNNNDIEIQTCSKQLLEIDIVLERPHIKNRLPLAGIQAIKTILKYRTNSILLISEINICRDKKDNFLLSLCVDSNSKYLITGDKDLLVLEKIQQCKILTLSDFMENHFENL